jgi:5-methylthioadenosine/S-adenosylhomocysteine deaminase
MPALVISGRIAAMAPIDPERVAPGRVWIADGMVTAVTGPTAPAPAGFGSAIQVDVGDAVVLPGFIDLHNHLGYNALPLWWEPSQTVPFLHNKHWPDADTYSESVTWPAWTLAKCAPEALLAYVQVRALVGGAACAQGWPSANRAVLQAMRNVDTEKAGTHRQDLIITSVVTKKALELGQIAQRMAPGPERGSGFVYHCAEGAAGSVVAKEWTDVANAGCLTDTFIGVHCTAVPDADWQRWPSAHAGAVAWSPFSNLWLYGQTTRIASARARNVKIGLGSDWGPSGTRNLLGEIKVARLASDRDGMGLSDFDLVQMLAPNSGDVLSRCWNTQVGRLVPGALADVTVVRPRGPGGGTAAPWRQIVAAIEADVALVVVGGTARYGDDKLMTAAGATSVDSFTVKVGKLTKRVALPPGGTGAAPIHWTWPAVTRALDEVRKHPAQSIADAEAIHHAFAGRIDAQDAPLILSLDMPGDRGTVAGPPPDPTIVRIPKLPSLVHDDAFFDVVDAHGFHGGVLKKLRTWFR